MLHISCKTVLSNFFSLFRLIFILLTCHARKHFRLCSFTHFLQFAYFIKRAVDLLQSSPSPSSLCWSFGYASHSLRKKCQYSELFWSAFSHIRTECGKLRTRITPNTDTFYVGTLLEFCFRLQSI